MTGPARTTVEALLARYDTFLLDAYGVLVDTSGALPGAAELVDRLRREQKRFLLLSNDASRLPSTTLRRYRAFGLDLREEDLITSGQLIADHFEKEGLRGARCIVLGTEDSARYVEDAGGTIVGREDETAEVVVVADDDGYPFLEGIEQVLTTLCRKLDRREPVELLLPNPDVIYPKGQQAYGLASGSVATVIEQALAVRYPGRAPRFVGLGKPHPRMFDTALAHVRATAQSKVVMIGDQLHTDIRGARDHGLDSALLATGLTRVSEALASADVQPTWVLDGLGELARYYST